MDAAQLTQFETLCTTLYTSPNQMDREHAQKSVLVLGTSAEYIPQCQYVLDNSKEAYALLVASNSLTTLITSHWNNFSAPQRVEIRNYILHYLASHGPALQEFVKTSLLKLVCRITKLGWFDDPQHQEITQEVTKFLQSTIDHCIIGLQLLNQLVAEINLPTAGRTLTEHRKTAVSFRDHSLFHIFQVALTTLRQLHIKVVSGSPAQVGHMAQYTLNLTIKCLSFDFIGTNPDESAEDVGAVQVPSAWRAIIQEPATMQLLFDLYASRPAAQASHALECLMLLASVRRSLFADDNHRRSYLAHLMGGILQILKTQQGLNEPDNYHEFCRLLARLKSNYQLSELVRADSYEEWIDLVAKFTINSFQQWQWSSNSMHYLLGLWAKLVVAVPYVKPDLQGQSTALLDGYVPQLIQAYVKSRLDAAEAAVRSESIEDLLDEQSNVQEQLERIPCICRYQYKAVGQYFISLFDPALQQYKDALGALTTDRSEQTLTRVEVLEGQLAWLVYIVAAIIGGHSWSSSQHKDGDELVDADLSRRIFELMQILELWVSTTQEKRSTQLELALLSYCHHFRRAYVGEQNGMPDLSSKQDHSQSTKHKMYLRMFERMGLGDHTVVVNMVITKMGKNLKLWADNEQIISKSLDLFFDMASGFSSGKLLMTLDTVAFMLANHTEDHFPFLSAYPRHRTTFHATLSRLLFSSLDDHGAHFDAFMKPLIDVTARLCSTADYRQESVKHALIGVCRDLRGVVSATHNRRTYSALFDVLYPASFPAFTRAAEVWFDEPAVTTALLKFIEEFVYNKAQRVMFDQSSPNGILLFRETSAIIVAYGSRILGHHPTHNIYAQKYKGIALSLCVLARGNYVNFGVFALYKDTALDNALDVGLQMCLSIPLGEAMSYPKVSKAYFAFLEVLFRNHLAAVLQLDTTVFIRLVMSMHEGLNSLDTPLSTQCAAAVDHLATFYFRNSTKDSPAIRALTVHLQLHPSVFTELMSTLFNILIYAESTNQWSLSRPILSLSLASEESFIAFQQQISATQSPDNQARLTESFQTLMMDVRRNLEPSNRDKFTQKVTAFRHKVRSFLTKDSLADC